MSDGKNYGYFWNDDGNGDREYNADSFEIWLKKFFTSGVFTGELQVTAIGNYSVSVASGYANVDGKVRIFEEATEFKVPTAHSTYPRIDTVVVQRDNEAKAITLKYITGAYSGQNPVVTPPVRTGSVYQLVLAEIHVGASATEITSDDIVDKRSDVAVCGLVTAVLGGDTEMNLYQLIQTNANHIADNTNAIENGLANITTLLTPKSVTIPAANWSGSVPYTVSVNVSGVKSTDDYEIIGFTPSSTSSNNKTLKEQLGYITYGKTAQNQIAFTCVEKKPTVDLPIIIRKVGV